ncbi:MAG: TetR/AcrR family transcriptional regulator [Pseudomonadales bacterium]
MKTEGKRDYSTREQLIDAAEQLFAEHGIDNVSLLDITRAAGQKNRGALQYHFGDKQTLINSVLDKHAGAISRQRAQILDALQAQQKWTLRDVVQALVVPVAARLEDPDGGLAYLKINSQLMASEGYAQQRRERTKQNPQARRLEKMTAEKMPKSDRAGVAAKMLLVDCLLFHGLATYISHKGKISRQVFLHTLIDSILAVQLA